MASEANIQKLYDQGMIDEAMNLAETEIEQCVPEDPELPILWVRLAWCHWRRQEYDRVRFCLAQAGEIEASLELAGYLAAYVDKDDVRLDEIAVRLPENVNVQNARIIRARDANSNVVALDELESVLAPFAESQEVSAANLYHNAARLMLTKGNTKEHFAAAYSLINEALDRYGQDMHWHHRAAAKFWSSHISERLERMKAAREAMAASVELWEKAIELDPNNQGFITNLENARKRAAEL